MPHDVCWTKPRDPQVKLVSSLLRTLRVDQENVPVVRVMSCKLHQTIDLPHQVGQIHSNSHDPPQLLVLKRAQAQLMVLSQSTTSYIGTQHPPHPPPLLQHQDIMVKYKINDEIHLAFTNLHPHHSASLAQCTTTMQPNIYSQLKQLPQQATSTVLSQLRELLMSHSSSDFSINVFRLRRDSNREQRAKLLI